MARVEGQSQPLSDDALKALDVSTEVSNDLIDYLGARTEGEAGTILRGAESKHGLEAWRLLSFASGPKGSYSDLRETRTVTRPPRCTKPADLAVHLASWEEKLLKLSDRTGSCPLTPEGKRWAILDLVPTSMERELESQIHLFRTYEDIKGHALDLANRIGGKSFDTHHLEES